MCVRKRAERREKEGKEREVQHRVGRVKGMDNKEKIAGWQGASAKDRKSTCACARRDKEKECKCTRERESARERKKER